MTPTWTRKPRDPRPDPTAVSAAMCRLIEQLEPPRRRLIDDPWLEGILGDYAKYGLMDPWGSGSLVGKIDGTAPGYFGLQLCRTLFIDEKVSDALAQGVTQVVIVGSGFDTRPYRLPGLEKVRVFELDQPDTIEYKRRAVARIPGIRADHVTFAPLDLETLAAARALTDAGVDPAEPTIVICEDVTQYLSEVALERLLTTVSTLGRGTDLIMTYVAPSTLRSHDGLAQVRGLSRNGKPWILGLRPSEVPDLLAAHGLTVVADVDATDYKERYLVPLGRKVKVSPEERTVLASA